MIDQPSSDGPVAGFAASSRRITFSPDEAGAHVGAEAAFSAYRDLYSNGSTVDRAAGAFHAEVQAFRLPRMLVFDRLLAGLSHTRDPKRVSRDGFDHVTLQLVLSGKMTVFADAAAHEVDAGQVAIFDTTQPQRTVTSGCRVVTITVARDVLEPRLRNDGSFHGRVLDRDRAGSLIDFLSALPAWAPHLAATQAETVAQTLGDLLAGSLTPDAPGTTPAILRGRTRVTAFVEGRIGDPDLSISAIAAGAGLSRSALYRLLAPEGGVERFVQRRRLLWLRRSLAAPGETRPVAVLAVEAGFASASHAVRRFRDVFGLPPGQFRQNATGRPEDGTEGSLGAALARWHVELL